MVEGTHISLINHLSAAAARKPVLPACMVQTGSFLARPHAPAARSLRPHEASALLNHGCVFTGALHGCCARCVQEVSLHMALDKNVLPVGYSASTQPCCALCVSSSRCTSSHKDWASCQIMFATER